MAPCSIISFGSQACTKHWCTTHHFPAFDSDGNCKKAKVISGDEEILLDLATYRGGIGLWGSVPPVFDTTLLPITDGVHVHARQERNGPKEIDRNYSVVQIKLPDEQEVVRIEKAAAYYYVAANIFEKKLADIRCPYCNHPHLDTDHHAVFEHRNHKCQACLQEFSTDQALIGNPLTFVKQRLGDPIAVRPARNIEGRTFSITQSHYPGGIQLWGSHSAILWTAPRQEEYGIHVHCYDELGKEVVDETYGSVEIDGVEINIEMTRLFTAQQILPHLQNCICCLTCPSCEQLHFDRQDAAFTPHKDHLCDGCGFGFLSPIKCVSNPVVDVFRALYANLSPTAKTAQKQHGFAGKAGVRS